MSKYIPLHVHSTYSLLDGMSSCTDITERITELELDGCAITDHGSISSAVQFQKSMKKANLKHILGNEFYVCGREAKDKCTENRNLEHLPLLAKNQDGWQNLLKLTSEANHPEHYYYKPRLSLEEIAKYSNNIIAFSGHPGSHVGNQIYSFSEGKLDPNWRAKATRKARELKDIFGDNFYLEVQLMDCEQNKPQKIIGECVREISKITNIPTIATPDAHYARKEDAILQRILLCINMKIKFSEGIKSAMSQFFKSAQYHIPSFEDMKRWHTPEELENTLRIFYDIEPVNLLSQPIPPFFPCPKGMDDNEYLRQLCWSGWKDKIRDSGVDEKLYAERVKSELKVFRDANLASYFLINKDITDYVRNSGWLMGPGRGSSSGCLVSYLLGITGIDSVKYGLLFERFYNAGRNTKEKVSYPDIDLDIPKDNREDVISYINNKYGDDNVGQMVTYHTLKGKNALKNVLRALGGIPFDEQNRITDGLIDHSKVTDELEKMKQERGYSSLIVWCLENRAAKFSEWVSLDENGELSGPLADHFKKAIKLEGVKTVQSRHASGVAIAPRTLDTICPMIYDKSTNSRVVGFEMSDCEDIGLLKFDILGLALLSKLQGISGSLLTGGI